MKQLTEEHIQQITKGNERVFKIVFDSYYPRLVGLASKYLNNQMEAEDIVTDVFRKVWEKRQYISEVGSFDSFLYTSVRNRTFNYIRNQSRKENHHQAILNDMPYEAFEETAFEENIHHKLYQAIEQLPPQGRKIFELSVLYGWKEKQIAEDLNISINTIKTHKKRTLKDLRERLGKYYIFLFFYL
ncbi:MAG: RNA polymerase sigma-70 factor [Marinilabiliaceae bacterium]|nr:RNA polymerase sigma-70 factor [Marinilabiliaceae bacterium]